MPFTHDVVSYFVLTNTTLYSDVVVNLSEKFKFVAHCNVTMKTVIFFLGKFHGNDSFMNEEISPGEQL